MTTMTRAQEADADQQERWREEAHCRWSSDPDAFFPEHGNSDSQLAKRICRRCSVRPECLQYALDNDETHGIWGGTTSRERRRIKRIAIVVA